LLGFVTLNKDCSVASFCLAEQPLFFCGRRFYTASTIDDINSEFHICKFEPSVSVVVTTGAFVEEEQPAHIVDVAVADATIASEQSVLVNAIPRFLFCNLL
jgi:hypothetical protein